MSDIAHTIEKLASEQSEYAPVSQAIRATYPSLGFLFDELDHLRYETRSEGVYDGYRENLEDQVEDLSDDILRLEEAMDEIIKIARDRRVD